MSLLTAVLLCVVGARRREVKSIRFDNQFKFRSRLIFDESPHIIYQWREKHLKKITMDSEFRDPYVIER